MPGAPLKPTHKRCDCGPFHRGICSAPQDPCKAIQLRNVFWRLGVFGRKPPLQKAGLWELSKDSRGYLPHSFQGSFKKNSQLLTRTMIEKNGKGKGKSCPVRAHARLPVVVQELLEPSHLEIFGWSGKRLFGAAAWARGLRNWGGARGPVVVLP